MGDKNKNLVFSRFCGFSCKMEIKKRKSISYSVYPFKTSHTWSQNWDTKTSEFSFSFSVFCFSFSLVSPARWSTKTKNQKTSFLVSLVSPARWSTKTKNKKLHFWFLVFVENNLQKSREIFEDFSNKKQKKQKTKMKIFVFRYFCSHLAREIEKNTKMIIFVFCFWLPSGWA